MMALQGNLHVVQIRQDYIENLETGVERKP
jgi:hypothetical protein